MELLKEILEPTVVDIWSSLLSLDVSAAPAVVNSDGTIDSMEFAAYVHVSGPSSGTIVVQCGEPMARIVAGRMFDADPASLGESDMRDAIGELANVAAGNMKAALAEPGILSLPTVIHGTEFRTSIPGSRHVVTQCFTCGNDLFSVSVFEQPPAPVP